MSTHLDRHDIACEMTTEEIVGLMENVEHLISQLAFQSEALKAAEEKIAKFHGALLDGDRAYEVLKSDNYEATMAVQVTTLKAERDSLRSQNEKRFCSVHADYCNLTDGKNHYADGCSICRVEHLGKVNDSLRSQLREARIAVLNQCADNLCWIKDGIDLEKSKALPWPEMQESCRRYHAQISSERGVFTEGRTIAQLEAEYQDVRSQLEAAQQKSLRSCWTCGGSPHPSGFECICGGTGIHGDEVLGLRERVIGSEKEIYELRCQLEAVTEALKPFAKLRVPEGASDGTWIAETRFCNTQVTAFSVRKARATLAKIGGNP